MPFRDWMHGVGKPVSGIDPLEDAKTADLDWTVATVRATGVLEDGTLVDKGQEIYLTYREDTREVIDSCRSRKPWNNVDVIADMYERCHKAGIKIVALGYLKHQAEIIIGAEIPITSDIKKCGDKTSYYFVIRHSHQTGKGLPFSLYSNREVCENGMNVVINNVYSRINHRQGLEENTVKITDAWDKVMDLIRVRERVSEQLADVYMDEESARVHLIEAFGYPGEPIEAQPRVVQTVLNLFKGEARGSNYLSAYNTAYGLLQSVTEYYNWGQTRNNSKTFASILNTSTSGRGGKMLNFEQQLVSCHIR